MCPSKLNQTGHREESAANTVIAKWQVASERLFPDSCGILVFLEKEMRLKLSGCM